MNYKGKTTIDFVINRIKDLNNDQYRLFQDGDDVDREEELVLNIEGRSYYNEGRSFGLLENCYPPEGETEILSIKWKGRDFPWELTEEETKEAEEQIAQAVQDNDSGPESDDYYDDDYNDYNYDDSDYDYDD